MLCWPQALCDSCCALNNPDLESVQCTLTNTSLVGFAVLTNGGCKAAAVATPTSGAVLMQEVAAQAPVTRTARLEHVAGPASARVSKPPIGV
jgi:hypothetical protein